MTKHPGGIDPSWRGDSCRDAAARRGQPRNAAGVRVNRSGTTMNTRPQPGPRFWSSVVEYKHLETTAEATSTSMRLMSRYSVPDNLMPPQAPGREFTSEATSSAINVWR
jgi:hypothetical protein